MERTGRKQPPAQPQDADIPALTGPVASDSAIARAVLGDRWGVQTLDPDRRRWIPDTDRRMGVGVRRSFVSAEAARVYLTIQYPRADWSEFAAVEPLSIAEIMDCRAAQTGADAYQAQREADEELVAEALRQGSQGKRNGRNWGPAGFEDRYLLTDAGLRATEEWEDEGPSRGIHWGVALGLSAVLWMALIGVVLLAGQGLSVLRWLLWRE